jgi:putative FmdB family regulatory protein
VPTYEYRCTECGEQLEAVQSFTDPPLTECPVCSGRLRKLFSAVGVVFKGSGFYKTDSRSGGKAAASSDSKVDATSDSKVDSTSSGAKADSKPAAKTESAEPAKASTPKKSESPAA